MDPRIQKLASVLVNYSVALKPGERLLIRAMSPDAEPLAQALYEEAFNAGGLPFVYIMMAQEDEIAVSSGASLEQLEAINPMLELMYKTCECVIRIDAPQNTRALSQYPAGRQRARAAYLSKLIGIQMVREADKTLRRCTTQYPTFGLAQNAGMSLRQYEDFLFSACKADQENPVALWEAVFESHKRLIDWLKGKKRLQVKGEHIDLEMSIEGRSFINAGGRHNMPDGEIFTGPVEDSVNGWVRFTYPGYYHATRSRAWSCASRTGWWSTPRRKATRASCSARSTRTPARAAWASSRSALTVTFRSSPARSCSTRRTRDGAHGGRPGLRRERQRQPVVGWHWDMICDMRAGGEIIVDGELFYKDGEFVYLGAAKDSEEQRKTAKSSEGKGQPAFSCLSPLDSCASFVSARRSPLSREQKAPTAQAGASRAPQVGFEPTTLRLTAGCSAVELLRKMAEGYQSAP